MNKFIIIIALSFLFVSCDNGKKETTLLPLGSNALIGVEVMNSVSQLIPNLTDTIVFFDTEIFDTDNMHDSMTNISRLTVNTPGLYLVLAKATFSIDDNGVRTCSILLNGASGTIGYNTTNTIDFDTKNAAVHVSVLYNFSEGDYIEMQVYHNRGSALYLYGTSVAQTTFSMVRISD